MVQELLIWNRQTCTILITVLRLLIDYKIKNVYIIINYQVLTVIP